MFILPALLVVFAGYANLLINMTLPAFLITYLFVLAILFSLGRLIQYRFAFIVLSTPFMFVAYINNVLFRARGSFLTVFDVSSAKTALSVSDHYSLAPDFKCVLFSLLILALDVYAFARLKDTVSINRFIITALCVVSVLFIVLPDGYYYVESSNMDTYADNDKNGYVLSLMHGLKTFWPKKPDGYNKEACRQILAAGTHDQDPADLPDIIVIVDETFSDLSVVSKGVNSNEVIPFVSGILNGELENTVSGYTYVPVLGGNTVNSEFEFLTGLYEKCEHKQYAASTIYRRKHGRVLFSACLFNKPWL